MDHPIVNARWPAPGTPKGTSSHHALSEHAFVVQGVNALQPALDTPLPPTEAHARRSAPPIGSCFPTQVTSHTTASSLTAPVPATFTAKARTAALGGAASTTHVEESVSGGARNVTCPAPVDGAPADGDLRAFDVLAYSPWKDPPLPASILTGQPASASNVSSVSASASSSGSVPPALSPQMQQNPRQGGPPHAVNVVRTVPGGPSQSTPVLPSQQKQPLHIGTPAPQSMSCQVPVLQTGNAMEHNSAAEVEADLDLDNDDLDFEFDLELHPSHTEESAFGSEQRLPANGHGTIGQPLNAVAQPVASQFRHQAHPHHMFHPSHSHSTLPLPLHPLQPLHHTFPTSPLQPSAVQHPAMQQQPEPHIQHQHQHHQSHPTRSVLLQNVPPNVDDDTLRTLLEHHGPLSTLGAQHRARGGRGSISATFFDLRHARAAVRALDGARIMGRVIEARFIPAAADVLASAITVGSSNCAPGSLPGTKGGSANSVANNGGNGRPVSPSGNTSNGLCSGSSLGGPCTNNGTLVVFNLDASTSAEDIRRVFGKIGDIKEVRATPNKRHHKFVEFYDVRDAERALRTLNKTEFGGKKIKIEVSRPGGRACAAAAAAAKQIQQHHQQQTPSLLPSPTHAHVNDEYAMEESGVGNGVLGVGMITSDAVQSASLPPRRQVGVEDSQGQLLRPSTYSAQPGSQAQGHHAHTSPLSHEEPRTGWPGLFAGSDRDMRLPAAHSVPASSPSGYAFLDTAEGMSALQHQSTTSPGGRSARQQRNQGVQMPTPQQGSDMKSVGSKDFMELPPSRPDGGGASPPYSPVTLARTPWNGDDGSFDDIGGGNINGMGGPVTSLRLGTAYAQVAALAPLPTDSGTVGPVLRKERSGLHGGMRPRSPGSGSGPRSPTRSPSAGVCRSPSQQHRHLSQQQHSGGPSPPCSTGTSGMPCMQTSNPKFALCVDKVASGGDARTALMIRNIPNKYSQKMLLAALEERHRGHFDFMYLPIDFKNRCNVGYAFINFVHPQYIVPFFHEFHGRKWGKFNSEKICEITYARIQGKQQLINHFQNSSLMNEDPKCRPVVFGQDGKQEEFPVGSNVRTRRGPSAREVRPVEVNGVTAPLSPSARQKGRNG